MPKLNIYPPLVNASGIFSYLERFKRLEDLGINLGAFIQKSWGLLENEGNKNPVVYQDKFYLMNSIGLSNYPLRYWEKEFKKYNLKIPIIGSVYKYHRRIIETMDEYVIGWELNVSCPNKIRTEKSVRDSVTIDDIVRLVKMARNTTDKPIIAKLSPNSDYVEIAKAVDPYVDYIGCANTFGPGLKIDIHTGHKIVEGGLSGPAYKPLVVKMVHEIRKETNAGIVAYGGIEDWSDVIEYAIAGAEIFGLGTVFRNKNSEECVRITNQIWDGVINFLEESNTSLEEIIGSYKDV